VDPFVTEANSNANRSRMLPAPQMRHLRGEVQLVMVTNDV